MNLTFKTSLIIAGTFIALISASYLKGCSDGQEMKDNEWRAQLAQAKPDTTTEQVKPDLPKPDRKKVKPFRGTLKPVSGTTLGNAILTWGTELTDTTWTSIQQVEFSDSLRKNLAPEGETPLPFFIKISHLVTFFPNDSTDVQTSWDALEIPVRTIKEIVLMPQTIWDNIELVLMGTGIGVVLMMVLGAVF